VKRGDDPGASEVSWRVVKKGFAWTGGELLPEPGEEAEWLERHRSL
jgi:hypothetical protein